MGVYRIQDAPKHLIAADGKYMRVETYEDAVEAMKYITRVRTDADIKSEKQSMKLYCLVNFGVAMLAAGLLQAIGIPELLFPIIALAAALAAIGITALKCLKNIREIRAKSEAVLSGEYYRGKPESQIIYEANRDYIDRINSLIGLERSFSAR